MTEETMQSADKDLAEYVEEMLSLDKRFVGMSRYVYNINFYWSSAINTACAGHGFIFFNPVFWDKLDREKRKSVIAHEIWHLILDHLNRSKDFDHKTYNIAADHVINNSLIEEGFVMGPNEDFGGTKPCCDPKYKGMSTSQVYADLEKEDQKKQKKSSKGNKEEDDQKQDHPTPDQIEDLVREVLEGSGVDLNQQIEKAKEATDKINDDIKKRKGKIAGNMPGNMLREITAINDVRIIEAPYSEIFKEFLIDPLGGGKRTILRPSRRQIKGGLRLKGRHPKKGKKNRLTKLVYALDVSGSISQTDAKKFLESAATIKKDLNPVEMIIMLWDTRIVLERTFREGEEIKNISIRAGGGTSLFPVYQRVEQIAPEALVIFTDLAVTIPPKPNFKVIWFVSNQNKISDYYKNQVSYGQIYQIPKEKS